MSATAERTNDVEESVDVAEAALELRRGPVPQLIAVTPQVGAGELVARLDVIREAMRTAMVQGVDYGRIPGTPKPTLFKPGAEKLSVLFQLDVQYANEKIWGPGEHLTVISHATVFHAPSRTRQGYGEGICTTREHNYAYRQVDRSCPLCGAQAVIKSKEEYGGGWACWRKRGGCGAEFATDDVRVTGQPVGDVENPDLPDLWNVVVKMAKKRAQVDAVLSVTGASALFTQDVAREPEPPPQASDHDPDQNSDQNAANADRPLAAPAKRSERRAAAREREALKEKAAAAGLASSEFANVIYRIVDEAPRVWEHEDHAAETLKRLLDKLPARLVGAVTKGIAEAKR